MKAIETAYKGYRFRSRLEARWAVFFDALGLAWEYEPEGFETSAGWYLPDFRLRETLLLRGGKSREDRAYLEVRPTHQEDAKFRAFADAVEATQPGETDCGHEYAQFLAGDPLDWVEKVADVIPGYAALPRYALMDSTPLVWFIATKTVDFEGTIRPAAVRARGARFEHGETA